LRYEYQLLEYGLLHTDVNRGKPFARMMQTSNAYKTLIEKRKGRCKLLKHGCRCRDNIKMDLKERGCEYVDWIHLAQGRDQWRALANTVMNLRIP
jgi:hypothetical protein